MTLHMIFDLRQRHDLPVIYVDRFGAATFFRPAPRSIKGANGSIVAGYRLTGFLSLGAERILRDLLWRNNPRRFVQMQICRRCAGLVRP